MPPKKGTGIKQMVDSRLNARPLAITNFLKQHGDEQIKRIIICRSPLATMFMKIGTWLTSGDFDKQKERLAYDEIFHLYMLVEIDKMTIRIEKNERVEITNKKSLGQDNIYLNDIPEGLTLNDLFDTTERYIGPEAMYRYNPWSTNCQNFVISMLKAFELITPEITAFVMQDANSLVKSEFLKNGTKYVTDLAALANYTIKGGKLVKKKYRMVR
jgi:hypothetical protein